MAVVPHSINIFIYNTVNKCSRLPVSAYSQPTIRPTHYVELTKNLHNSPYINLAKRSHSIPIYTNVIKLVQKGGKKMIKKRCMLKQVHFK